MHTVNIVIAKVKFLDPDSNLDYNYNPVTCAICVFVILQTDRQIN